MAIACYDLGSDDRVVNLQFLLVSDCHEYLVSPSNAECFRGSKQVTNHAKYE